MYIYVRYIIVVVKRITQTASKCFYRSQQQLFLAKTRRYSTLRHGGEEELEAVPRTLFGRLNEQQADVADSPTVARGVRDVPRLRRWGCDSFLLVHVYR